MSDKTASNTKTVTVLKKETLYKGFLNVSRYQLQHSLHEGGMSEPIVREVVERGHAVAVLLHDPTRDEIILVEQFRIGAIHNDNVWLVELVAGVIEPGEEASDVAQREAKEECGADINELKFITKYYCSAGGSTETTVVFYAKIDSSQIEGVHGVEGENEDIRVVKVSTKEFLNILDTNDLQTASMMIAGLWFKNKIKELCT